MMSRMHRALNALWYGASPFRWPLLPLAWSYCGLVRLRRHAYGRGWLRKQDVGVPVIVVGNVTAGGTGKTPLVIWLAGALLDRGYRVGVICRGHGGRARAWPQPVARFSDAAWVGDEAKLLARRLSCPVAAGPDRAAAARLLLSTGPLDVIVSDDGLQHYRLERRFEIAVVDGTRGLGNGACLPAGPLREPASRLGEVDAVVVNGGGFDRPGALRAKLLPTRVLELASGMERSLAEFAGQRVHAVAGVGNPERFFELLDVHGLKVDPHPLADHAVIAQADIDFGDDLPVLMTEKDAVKCGHLNGKDKWFVEVELELAESGGERLLRAVTRSLSGPVNDP